MSYVTDQVKLDKVLEGKTITGLQYDGYVVRINLSDGSWLRIESEGWDAEYGVSVNHQVEES
jgi:hypothetical protein